MAYKKPPNTVLGIPSEEVVKVLKGAAVAAAGAGITYLAQWASSTDFGVWTPTVVAASSVIVNYLRKLLGMP